jgi:hypothetical protein
MCFFLDSTQITEKHVTEYVREMEVFVVSLAY